MSKDVREVGSTGCVIGAARTDLAMACNAADIGYCATLQSFRDGNADPSRWSADFTHGHSVSAPLVCRIVLYHH
jgi:hypothetical protein